MPRDLDLERSSSEEFPPLTPEPNVASHERPPEEDEHVAQTFEGIDHVLGDIEVADDTPEIVKELHPYSQVLGLNDLESCVKLEEAAFPPEHRCSREKFMYRLSKCSTLSLGLFTSVGHDSPPQDVVTAPQNVVTASTANPPDSNEPERKGVLLAHIIATKTTNDAILDEDMMVPPNWENDPQADSNLGHKEEGRTLALHSLAVLPAYQGMGLGKILIKAYVQRMVEADAADMISILSYDELVPFYERLGFVNEGRSRATFGGGNWVDMALDFADIPSDDEIE